MKRSRQYLCQKFGNKMNLQFNNFTIPTRFASESGKNVYFNTWNLYWSIELSWEKNTTNCVILISFSAWFEHWTQRERIFGSWMRIKGILLLLLMNFGTLFIGWFSYMYTLYKGHGYSAGQP